MRLNRAFDVTSMANWLIVLLSKVTLTVRYKEAVIRKAVKKKWPIFTKNRNNVKNFAFFNIIAKNATDVVTRDILKNKNSVNINGIATTNLSKTLKKWRPRLRGDNSGKAFRQDLQ